jgi:hypothetical protein
MEVSCAANQDGSIPNEITIRKRQIEYRAIREVRGLTRDEDAPARSKLHSGELKEIVEAFLKGFTP